MISKDFYRDSCHIRLMCVCTTYITMLFCYAKRMCRSGYGAESGIEASTMQLESQGHFENKHTTEGETDSIYWLKIGSLYPWHAKHEKYYMFITCRYFKMWKCRVFTYGHTNFFICLHMIIFLSIIKNNFSLDITYGTLLIFYISLLDITWSS